MQIGTRTSLCGVEGKCVRMPFLKPLWSDAFSNTVVAGIQTQHFSTNAKHLAMPAPHYCYFKVTPKDEFRFASFTQVFFIDAIKKKNSGIPVSPLACPATLDHSPDLFGCMRAYRLWEMTSLAELTMIILFLVKAGIQKLKYYTINACTGLT